MLIESNKKRNEKPKPQVYDLYGQLVELKNVQSKQLKPVFCISNTNIKKQAHSNNEISTTIKSKIEQPAKTLVKLKSRLDYETEVETGYVTPGEIKYLFDKVKISDGVRLIENGQVRKETKPDTTLYGNTAFRITKTNYNKM